MNKIEKIDIDQHEEHLTPEEVAKGLEELNERGPSGKKYDSDKPSLFFFDNFFNRFLPLENYGRRPSPEQQDDDFNKKTYGQAYLEDCKEHGWEVEDNHYSSLMANQTPADFYRTIDETTLECGISMEEIREASSAYAEAKHRMTDLRAGNELLEEFKVYKQSKISEEDLESGREKLSETGSAFARLIAPIYLKLRQKGYSRGDLTS